VSARPSAGTVDARMDSVLADPPGPAGSLIVVRHAASTDRDALVSMFERCTLETRYRRFHAPVKRIPERYLAEALSGTPFHHALVAWTAQVAGVDADADGDADADADQRASHLGPDQEARPPTIVALASCRLIDEGAAELGVLIEDAWQRQGLGTSLVRDLVAHATGIGLRVLKAQLLVEQAWIAGLLRPYGACRIGPAGGGVLNVTVRLGAGRREG
jgi:GNAT superfamily N-acetyltransferase